ncbi:hypothetical protein AB0M46_16630 [Dactylosporangium sp. NPDC051485]|uniref:hypothetical protein n=1 Tax=Dactylosporangium sp. NPDC051485 TaxID=3154846 RepID=UPI003443BF4B
METEQAASRRWFLRWCGWSAAAMVVAAVLAAEWFRESDAVLHLRQKACDLHYSAAQLEAPVSTVWLGVGATVAMGVAAGFAVVAWHSAGRRLGYLPPLLFVIGLLGVLCCGFFGIHGAVNDLHFRPDCV